MTRYLFTVLACFCIVSCKLSNKPAGEFPPELVSFVPYHNNPVFSGTDTNTWDHSIRERGWILREDSTYYMWYNGYADIENEKHLGFATSKDGYHWSRYSADPIYASGWVEDMCVVRHDSLYYMFAEGRGDTAHLLTSPDKIHWTERGNLDIRQTNGTSIRPGPYGTPSVYIESGTWYLFYERDDLGIWLATSKDAKVWKNVQDSPVIALGPESYDQFGVAMNQVIKYEGHYYGYYHATAFKDWHEWSTNVAMSEDLIHWKKFPGNPIEKENKSSGILVDDGRRLRLYTMHDKVQVHFPVTDSLP